MITRLLALLRSPYPQLCKRWKAVVYPSLIVFFILYLFQPFGISRIQEHKLWILIGYGLVSSLALSVFSYLLPMLFPRYYKEESWTLGRDLVDTLLMCILIAFGNALYSIWIFHWELNWNIFIVSFFWVIILAPFPIVFFQLWNRNLLLSRNLREATKLNTLLMDEGCNNNESSVDCTAKGFENGIVNDESSVSTHLTFFNGAKDLFQLAAHNMLYVEAEGNYVNVVYLDENKVTQKLLRATMRQAEDAVRPYPYIMRCHRAYLVNIHVVAKVDGNMQGYRLRLNNCMEEVPVSRAYTRQFKIHLKNIRK